jgi:hypothetical protein
MAFDIMNRIMPPFFARQDGTCGSFPNAHWLSDADQATLVAWINGDKLEGDPADSVAAPPPPPGLAQVDTTIDMGADYTPNTATPDDYQCFIVPALTAFDNKFVIGAHVKPGNLTVAHHAILYTLDTQAENDAESKLAAAQAANANAVSYECPSGPTQAGRADFLVGWVPGNEALQFPPTTGIRLDGTRKMVLQMHYNTANTNGMPDRTTIDLDTADTVTLPARMLKIIDTTLNLAPNQADVTAGDSVTIPNNLSGQLWGALFHMHGRGKSAKLVRSNTNNECLVDLVSWNFHWQHFYWYEDPVQVNGGDTLQLTCHYDTTGATAPVTFCENTDCEMCIAFGYATL